MKPNTTSLQRPERLMPRYIAIIYAAVAVGACNACVAVASEPLLDPTRPLTYSSGENKQEFALTLQAVFLRGSGHQAVIDGRIVGVGDTIADMKVDSIGRNKVRLVNGEGARELQLRPSILSTPESEG